MTIRTRKKRSPMPRGEAVEIACAFCGGKGLDPFGIMSPLATCQVCDGEGRVTLTEPTARCAFCHGTGVHPNTRMTCIVCDGVGEVEIAPASVVCPHCDGSGRTADCDDCGFPQSIFPCQHCKGKGFMAGNQS